MILAEFHHLGNQNGSFYVPQIKLPLSGQLLIEKLKVEGSNLSPSFQPELKKKKKSTNLVYLFLVSFWNFIF